MYFPLISCKVQRVLAVFPSGVWCLRANKKSILWGKMDLGVKPLSFTSSNASWKSKGKVSDQFPAGLRVLVVDDDPTCLRILEKMLRNCMYEATTCNRAELALKFLRDNKNGYDIVISDVHMPDMDGFKLLEHVGLEMDLPVIMMSADDSKNVVMKGVTHGACDYLIKPIRMEALKNIWQHVVRKRKYEWKEKDSELSGSLDEQKPVEDLDYSSSANEGTWRSSKKRKDEEDEAEERDDTSTLKKPRVVWSVELHQQFVTAVNQLGIDKAVPKKILELMSVPGLTRENVASHLQKYRLYLRRLSGVSQHPNAFLGPPDAAFGPMAFAASGQIQPQSLATIQAAALGRTAAKSLTPVSLVDQRHLFSLENPKLRSGEGQQHQSSNSKSKQVSLLHGIPTNMDSKQLAAFRQSSRSFGSNGNHVSNLTSSAAQPALSQMTPSPVMGWNEIDFSRSLTAEFPGNSFSVASDSSLSSKLQDEVNSEMKGSRGFLPNYNAFEGLNQNIIQDWRSRNVGSTIETPQHSNVPSALDVSIQQHFSTVSDNQLRIKTERLPDMGFQNGLFPEHFVQEDLMSALLKQHQEGVVSVENDLGFDGYHLDDLPV